MILSVPTSAEITAVLLSYGHTRNDDVCFSPPGWGRGYGSRCETGSFPHTPAWSSFLSVNANVSCGFCYRKVRRDWRDCRGSSQSRVRAFDSCLGHFLVAQS